MPATTFTAPVAVLNVRPAGTVEPEATDRVALLGDAATPFNVSAVKALTTAVAPVRPLIPEALSLDATITANTVSVSVDSLLAGLISKVPAGAVIRAVLTAVCAIAAPDHVMAITEPAVESRRTRTLRLLLMCDMMLFFSMIIWPGRSKRVWRTGRVAKYRARCRRR